MDKTDLIYYAAKKQWPKSYVVDSGGIIELFEQCGTSLSFQARHTFRPPMKCRSYNELVNAIFNKVMEGLTLEERNAICRKGPVDGDKFSRFWS